MNEQEGLAQNSAEEMIEQVVDMLRQGATPEQLMQMGVPKEVIMQAMQMLQGEGRNPAQGGQLPQASEGMNGMSMPNTLNNM